MRITHKAEAKTKITLNKLDSGEFFMMADKTLEDIEPDGTYLFLRTAISTLTYIKAICMSNGKAIDFEPSCAVIPVEVDASIRLGELE